MIGMTFLGVGTALPDKDRGYTHMVWQGPGGPLLIDAGGNTYQRLLRANVEPFQLRGIILTHDHADHINGLPALLLSLHLAGMQTTLPIYGLAQTLGVARIVVDAFHLEGYLVPVHWQIVQPGNIIPLDDEWQIRITCGIHSRDCLALRFEERNGTLSLVCSGDTAPSPAVQALAHRATVLIHEATVATPCEAVHTTPFEAGEIAAAAQVARLVLVHFSPRWTMPEEQALAQIQAAGFKGIAEIGREYQTVLLSEE